MQVSQEDVNKMGAELLRDKRALNEMTAEILQDKTTLDGLTIGIAAAADGMTQLRTALHSIVTQTMSAAERVKKDVEIERQAHELRCADLRRQLETSLEAAKTARTDIAHKQAEITELRDATAAELELARVATRTLDEREKTLAARERAHAETVVSMQQQRKLLDGELDQARKTRKALDARLAELAHV